MSTQNKPKIYVESSPISYLAARPTTNVIAEAKRKLTHLWWKQKSRYELFISNFVIEEISEGDPEAAEARLEIVEGLVLLPVSEIARQLANALLKAGAVPERSRFDASHIAYAAVHGMDFLVTWNQKHIATDKKRKQIEGIIEEFDFKPPRLLTPEAYMIYEETQND